MKTKAYTIHANSITEIWSTANQLIASGKAAQVCHARYSKANGATATVIPNA